MKKSNLPSKVCPVYKRPFTWRKKWKLVWNEVIYCSKRCRVIRTSRRSISGLELAEFIGKDALLRIRKNGVRRKQVGLRIEGTPLAEPNNTFWDIRKNGNTVGKVTSAVYSPRLEQNIALAIVSAELSEIGNVVDVSMRYGTVQASIVETPFFDPNKKIVAA